MSWHNTLHGIGFMMDMLALLPACFVFGRRFASLGQWGWAAYCAVTAMTIPALIFVSGSNPGIMGIVLFGLALVIMSWVTVIAARLRSGRI